MPSLTGTIIDFPERNTARVRRDAVLIWDSGEGKIVSIEKEKGSGKKKLILPGFIDLHTHWPQWCSRGLANADLLAWLKKYIYSRESSYSNSRKAREDSRDFFFNLVKNGITTAVVYSTIHTEATDIAFEEAENIGLRIVMGKMMMDRSPLKELSETTRESIEDSLYLLKKWHSRHNKIFYAFSPRFALAVSRQLLEEIASLAHKHNAYIQTHLAESKDEIEEVKRITNYPSYTKYYYDTGILSERTLLGHCIYVSESDIRLIKRAGSTPVHNPSANLFLHSGVFPLHLYDRIGVDFGLGSDVGAGISLLPFSVMRDMYYLNRVPIPRLFYHYTTAGAKALGKLDEFGTIDIGKDADFIVLDYPESTNKTTDAEELLSKLVFTGTEELVREVYVRGELVFER